MRKEDTPAFLSDFLTRRSAMLLDAFRSWAHANALLYAPFALLSLILFAAYSRRSTERWILVGSLLLVALFFLTLIPFN